ncbi:MAG TPA: exodeoxyribonuclease VII small subunit [Ferruginibacter sp.]|nr:exodeoxyribonuclease VII small subunit [Ferruginibacter sp.]
MSKTLSYSTAMAELAAIAAAMENETISVDDLSDKVKRAQELIAFCQDKLKRTDDDVRKVLSKEAGKGKI